MRESNNLASLVELQPDFVGFIFFDKSPRFVGEQLDEAQLKSIPRNTKKVGVFVNANPDYILKTVKKYDLQFIQLHGSEDPIFCKSLKNKGINIIKAFALDEAFNFSSLNNFKPHCDFFLFDTKGQSPGGNGFAFDWAMLANYDNEKPFFLSGGLSLENIEQATKLEGLKIYGFDINSKFELEPGLKDIGKIEQLLEIVRPVEKEIE